MIKGIVVRDKEEINAYSEYRGMEETVIDIHNEIVPVLNLHKRFHVEPLENCEKVFLIIFDWNHKQWAVPVDKVEQCYHIAWESVNLIPTVVKGGDNRFLYRIVNIDGRLVQLLSMESLLGRV